MFLLYSAVSFLLKPRVLLSFFGGVEKKSYICTFKCKILKTDNYYETD